MLADVILLLSPQADGGYVGADFATFFSAVVSGAAGLYVVMLVEDAGIGIDLIVTPGQTVSVLGDPSVSAPAWCALIQPTCNVFRFR